MTTQSALGRRTFLAGLGALSVATLVGCNASADGGPGPEAEKGAATSFSWTDARGRVVEFALPATTVVAQSSVAATLLDFGYQVAGAYGDLKPIDGKLSYYSFDAGTPITAGTWRAITAAANVALTGQAMVAAGESAVFSLCRPPGHHAGSDFYGGYCFFNNAAVAAQAFIDGGAGRVAVLDVDYHHGNGTQEIFYERDDVLTISIHADPKQEFPYFLGHADETGVGRGKGFHVNLPLRWGSAWDKYEAALEAAVKGLIRYGPEAVVVSLGVDTFEHDPISKFKLRHDDYLRIGQAIAKAAKPTLFVMEGGYAVEALGVNAVNVLTGYEQVSRR